MKYLKQLLFLFLLVPACVVQAQWYDPAKVPLKLSYKYGSALNEAKNKNYVKALELLNECIAEDKRFVDAWLSKAGILSEQKQYAQSVELYRHAIQLDSVYTTTYLLPYSIALAGKGLFPESLEAINRFLQKPNLNERILKAAQYRKRSYEFALQKAAENNDQGFVFTPRNLGDSINTAVSEYFPTLTIDGKQLIYTRRVNNFNEDFYVSENKNGTWSRSVSVPGDLNTADNEGAQNISQDGKMLVFTGCNMDDGEGNCDLYVSYLTKNGWSQRMNMGRTINTEYWESQPSLSPDKRTLYFAARDPSGLGGSDLFVSYRQPNGQWGNPQNLGAGINTAGDESSPFLHADNQTLYFTSNGHPGYGGTDLYVMRRQADGSWSTPINLGYPINTIDDEGTLIIAADGVTAYYASDGADSRGGLDLYTFQLPASIRPVKTLWVTGTVFDKNTKAGLPSAVELIDLQTAQRISKVQTDEDGSYLITLPVGKNYAFNVNRKGYLFYSETFALGTPSGDTTYKIDIPLQPLEVNAKIVLKNIFFGTNQAVLKPESMIELDKVVELLAENPTLRIEIDGHTDATGSAAANMALSNNRAKAVVTYLVSKGVALRRLVAKGFGSTQPVADNNTEAGRAQNRRTELKVLAK